MCMHVKSIPAEDTPILKCIKYLDAHRLGGWMSPYQGQRVPNNGFLKPRKPKTNHEFFYGDRVEDGYIHSFTKPGDNTGIMIFWANRFDAFAFNVRAYENNEMISDAVWVPDCCTDLKLKNKTLEYFETNFTRRGLATYLKRNFDWTLRG